MSTVIFCRIPTGGVAEHANYQARAFSEKSKSGKFGAGDVVVLCSPDFLNGRVVGYKKAAVFSVQFSVFSRVAGRVGGGIDRSLGILGEQWRLAWEILRRKPDVVLLSSYSEYLAPLWVWPHWILSKLTPVVYVANLHDPVRDYVVGPKWWHDLSVRMAYWPISVGVVHQRLPETSPVPTHVHVVEAPVGVYDLQESPEDPEAIRAAWGVGRRDSEKLKADLTTEDTESTEEVSTTDCTDEHGYVQKAQGDAQVACAGASESDSLASELADSPVSESSPRSASGPALARIAARGMGSDGGSKKKAESLKLRKAESENALDAGHSPLDTAPEALALDPRRSTLDASSPATSHSAPATPASPEVVFLAFGFIRDNKNLDLVIRALVGNPAAVLVVMGRAQSKKDKPLEFYRDLAEELGVQDRVKFFDGFVPDERLASYFAAADVVVLTYDGTFHSQSGVLNVAARARRPVLASAGESPLKDCVEKFRLGVFVVPDDLEALKEGMKNVAGDEWRVAGGEPDWEGYEKFASWDVNVTKILEGVEEVRQKKKKHGARSMEKEIRNQENSRNEPKGRRM